MRISRRVEHVIAIQYAAPDGGHQFGPEENLPLHKHPRYSLAEARGLCGVGRVVDQLGNDLIGRLLISFGMEVGHDAVPQHRGSDRADVVEVNMQAPLNRSAGLGRQNQMLALTTLTTTQMVISGLTQ